MNTKYKCTKDFSFEGVEYKKGRLYVSAPSKFKDNFKAIEDPRLKK